MAMLDMVTIDMKAAGPADVAMTLMKVSNDWLATMVDTTNDTNRLAHFRLLLLAETCSNLSSEISQELGHVGREHRLGVDYEDKFMM
jgi:hypothetical protein